MPRLGYNFCVDETPEELERIRQEAEEIDVYRYRRRRRGFYAILLGAVMAGAVWLGLEMMDKRRNPCERLRKYFCHVDAKSLNCTTYEGIQKESEADGSVKMRRNIRHQCERKIARMQEEDSVKVP